MVWDLGKAMHKKEEFESSRLMDFEFRQRVRATRLLAKSFALSESAWAGEVAMMGEVDLLDRVAEATGQSSQTIRAAYLKCMSEARLQLVAELGDPAPYRLG